MSTTHAIPFPERVLRVLRDTPDQRWTPQQVADEIAGDVSAVTGRLWRFRQQRVLWSEAIGEDAVNDPRRFSYYYPAPEDGRRGNRRLGAGSVSPGRGPAWVF
jgi:hypothetical protein